MEADINLKNISFHNNSPQINNFNQNPPLKNNSQLFLTFSNQISKTLAKECFGVAFALQGFGKLRDLAEKILFDQKLKTIDPMGQIFFKSISDIVRNPGRLNQFKNISTNLFWNGDVNYYQCSFQKIINSDDTDSLIEFIICLWGSFYMRKIPTLTMLNFLKELNTTLLYFKAFSRQSIIQSRKTQFTMFIILYQKERTLNYEETFLFIDDHIIQYLSSCFVLQKKRTRNISLQIVRDELRKINENPQVTIVSYPYEIDQEQRDQLQVQMIQAVQQMDKTIPFQQIMKKYYRKFFSHMGTYSFPINYRVLALIQSVLIGYLAKCEENQQQ